MNRLLATVWLLSGLGFSFAQPAKDDAERQKELAKKPQYERMLKGEDAKKAVELQAKIIKAEEAEARKQALTFADELLFLRSRAQGEDHWEVRDATQIRNELRRPPLSAEQRKLIHEAEF